MGVDLYVGCLKCQTALHVAQDGLSGFTFCSGQPDTMDLLKLFLAQHYLCDWPDGNPIRFMQDHQTDDWKLVFDSHGEQMPDFSGDEN